MNETRHGGQIVVIGGGLAGLSAATYAALAGANVTVLEKGSHTAGRAETLERDGFVFNLGPHAVYNHGTGKRIYDELGIAVEGGPPGNRAAVMYEGRLHGSRGGVGALVTTRYLGVRARVQVLRALAAMAKWADPDEWDGRPFSEWVAENLSDDRARTLVLGLSRFTSYSNAPDHFSAGAMMRQFRMAAGGVTYVHGGWRTLAGALRAKAEEAGATVVTRARVEEVLLKGGSVGGVRLASGEVIPTDAVVVAASPGDVAGLLAENVAGAARRWDAEAVPSLVATLDLGLARLPNSRREVVAGTDQPLYLSVHSVNARLAPRGAALVHVMKYLEPGNAPDPEADLRELEALMDLAHPGWREVVVHRRFLPHMVAANTVPLAARGGLGGRPGVAYPGVDGLFIAGDWVGPEGLLSDCSLASGKAAGVAAATAAATTASATLAVAS